MRAAHPWLFLAPALLLVGGVLLLPLGVGISYAFMGMSADNLFGEAGFAGLDNFRALAADPKMGLVLRNTLVWTVASLLMQCLLGLGLALLLRHGSASARRLQALLFLPWAVPSVLIGLVWKMLLSPYTSPLPRWLAAVGLLPSATDVLAEPQWALLGPVLANVWFGIPFFAITLLAALQAIPGELYEAAALDGATPWQGFARVTLPLILPTLLITLLLRSVWILNFGDLVWIMTQGGPAGATQILPTYLFTLAFTDLNEGQASALALAQLALLLAYAALVMRLRSRFAGRAAA
jgi:multiple sugar transport system permease protein